jgi:hypothetical protein
LISRKNGLFLTEMEPNAPRLGMVARRPHDCDNPAVRGSTFIQSDTREVLITLSEAK